MESKELLQKIVLRLGKFRLLIFVGGLAMGALLFFYSKTIPPVFTSRASVFPLTAGNDNSAANNALNTILGISETPKSFSQEASINIVELATSRNTRESVAMTKIDSLGNRTIAELVIENYNKSRGMFTPAIKMPTDPKLLAAIGGNLLREGFNAKINKNGILELNYSSTDPNLVSPISYVFISKISEFYKDLKTRKAKIDYDFTVRKIDSLNRVLNNFDRQAIHMNNTTLFVPSEKIQYIIPKENLASAKERVMRQRDASANNREEALWRLQKVTPIIDILDRPDPPFNVKQPSSTIYAFVGFLLGCLLFSFIFVANLLYAYAKKQADEAIFGNEVEDTTVSTTVA